MIFGATKVTYIVIHQEISMGLCQSLSTPDGKYLNKKILRAINVMWDVRYKKTNAID